MGKPARRARKLSRAGRARRVFTGGMNGPMASTRVYLNNPFVLSWSMLEAIAAGCLVVGVRYNASP